MSLLLARGAWEGKPAVPFHVVRCPSFACHALNDMAAQGTYVMLCLTQQNL
jgi:hypothetical protein